MDLVNLVNGVEILRAPDFANRMGMISADELQSFRLKGDNYVWASTSSMTRWAYNGVRDQHKDLAELDPWLLIRQFIMEFCARDALLGTGTLVFGDVSDSEVSALSILRSQTSAIIFPTNTPKLASETALKSSALLSLSAPDNSRFLLRDSIISNVVVLATGDKASDIELIAKNFALVTEGAMLIIMGSVQSVKQISSALVDGVHIRAWAEREFPSENSRRYGTAEFVVVLSVDRPGHLHNFLSFNPPMEQRNIVLSPDYQKLEPHDLTFVHRSDVAKIASEVITHAPEREVRVKKPLFLEGGAHLERLWTEQFGQTLQETYDPGHYSCPPLEAYRFENLRAVGAGPLVTEGNFLFESSLQVMDRDQMAWWSCVHQSDVLYSNDRSQSSKRSQEPKYIIEEPSLLIINPGLPMHYHFLFDFLPRLMFRSGEMKDYAIAAPNTLKRYQIDALQRFYGIPDQKLFLFPIDDGATLFRNAVVTPSLVSDFWAMPEAIMATRSALNFSSAPKDPRYRNAKRLYVSRRDEFDSRRLINEDEIKAVLDRLGFCEIFPGDFSYDEEMYLFQNAEIIVGPFGSGMANIVFASPGARIIFLHPDSTNWRILSFIMDALNVEYGYIFGDAFKRSGRGHNTEWVIDASLVERRVSALL